MRFSWLELPDDHVFLNRARSLVDGYFKVAAWLAIAATFQVAAEATKSWLIWTICGLGYVMILLYLQSFISWLGKAKFGVRGWSIGDLASGKRSKKRLVRWTSDRSDNNRYSMVAADVRDSISDRFVSYRYCGIPEIGSRLSLNDAAIVVLSIQPGSGPLAVGLLLKRHGVICAANRGAAQTVTRPSTMAPA